MNYKKEQMMENSNDINSRYGHILLCFKDFSKNNKISHSGMGVTAKYTAKTLNQHGYFAQALPIFDAASLSHYIAAREHHKRPVTHVVIMAQFIKTPELAVLASRFPEVKFALNCHSNAGFLQAEPAAIEMVREAIDLETCVPNFHAASNSKRLGKALSGAYGRPVTFLPNLYYIHGSEPVHRPHWHGGLLKIGCFGSLRVYKNFSTCIVAAIKLTSLLKCHSEIWINQGRSDGAGNIVYKTALAWTRDLPHVTLKQFQWAQWPEFKRMAGAMHLMLQVSYTETFNNVTADGIAEGTPSVVSEAIDWCPKSWKAEPDDASDVANVGRRLLFDPHASQDGYHALKHYVKLGLPYWHRFIRSTDE